VSTAPKPSTERHIIQFQRRLGRNVRALRTLKNLTVKQAAARVEMYWRHWQKDEAGEVNVTLRTFTQIAVALKVDPRELLLSRPLPVSEKPARKRQKKKTGALP
jgi:transcriptional regulator with XRE-family HTH domain